MEYTGKVYTNIRDIYCIYRSKADTRIVEIPTKCIHPHTHTHSRYTNTVSTPTHIQYRYTVSTPTHQYRYKQSIYTHTHSRVLASLAHYRHTHSSLASLVRARTRRFAPRTRTPPMSLPLTGSTRLITEFFEYSINAILYQRGVYPADDFSTVRKYGLPLLRTHDPELQGYIRTVLRQVHRWVLGGKCSKLVLCVVARDTGEVAERWAFDIAVTPEESHSDETHSDETHSDEVQRQMRAVMRQVTASVTFLPELPPGAHTFNVLAYTDAHATVPLEWGDAPDSGVAAQGAEAVQFRSFATGTHTVGVGVQYAPGALPEQ